MSDPEDTVNGPVTSAHIGGDYTMRQHELAVTNMLIFRHNHGRWPYLGDMLMTRRSFHLAYQDALRMYAVGIRLEVSITDILTDVGHKEEEYDAA